MVRENNRTSEEAGQIEGLYSASDKTASGSRQEKDRSVYPRPSIQAEGPLLYREERRESELYSHRMQIIEPVFSNITYCKGMDRFTLRGKKKIDAQWKLYCIVHNIGKCVGALLKKLVG
jgi:hypothetical protein